MTFADLQNRVVVIGEDCGDTEVDYANVHELYLDVLVAIANRQCEGAPSREFAKEAIKAELTLYSLSHYTPETWQALQDRLAGKPPPPEPEPAPSPPPTKPKKAARKKPKAKTKGNPPRGKSRNRR